MNFRGSAGLNLIGVAKHWFPAPAQFSWQSEVYRQSKRDLGDPSRTLPAHKWVNEHNCSNGASGPQSGCDWIRFAVCQCFRQLTYIPQGLMCHPENHMILGWWFKPDLAKETPLCAS
jgi:hypothetical protein